MNTVGKTARNPHWVLARKVLQSLVAMVTLAISMNLLSTTLLERVS